MLSHAARSMSTMGITNKTVAIIGCGVAGLGAVKSCVEEGLQPTCFERSDGVGGLWYYRDNNKGEMVASVARSTVTNTSKETMCYSDFLFPKEWPNYLHNSYIKQYCDMYADKFGLKKHIRFMTRVTRLAQAPDYEHSGRWVVTTRPEGAAGHEGETSQEFDAVMICTGMYNNPYIPEFPGLDEFQGKVMHSRDYRRPEEFEGKRVVVVGIANSAVDAATDVSRVTSQVYLSTKRGAWLTGRRGGYGVPFDLQLTRRYFWIPNKLKFLLFRMSLKRQFNFVTTSIIPSHPLLSCEFVVNDELPTCILNGSIIIKAAPARFTRTGLEFEDGTREDDIDAVIMATGYRFKFPFKVDCPALETKQGKVPLYKLLFPLGMRHSTLSVNGAIKPLGSVIPCLELQARWAARVFAGLATLPAQPEMEAEVQKSDERMKGLYLPFHYHVGSISYEDYIASEIGAKPNFWRLFFTEPLLTLRCLFGPHVPCIYRLVGPGKKTEDAKRAISKVWERVEEPLMTRRVK
ncbi:dimethylaniline monooxygenase [N-oxide-forming] 5-like [Acanthaster planci]|uniref:Flavin-containing monooxygenase n=1 Tax=Acanthaster planci TaxID=133434 RepID=A0A8B7XP83_ACAPL|nr:dimethylaniline monooxygenase [N-oxide-forming] 5-like [Acanthaster planci]